MSFSSLVEIVRLLKLHGARLYGGEAVTQLDHALQCATLAEEAGADDALITAALLHDVGHLLEPKDGHGFADGDFGHEHVGAQFLLDAFGVAVAGGLVCTSRPSAIFARKTALATGPRRHPNIPWHCKVDLFSGRGSASLAEPYAEEAVNLRRWDDGAKVAGVETAPLSHYVAIAERVLTRRHAAGM
jgi:predicted HD phosphohydrolase